MQVHSLHTRCMQLTQPTPTGLLQLFNARHVQARGTPKVPNSQHHAQCSVRGVRAWGVYMKMPTLTRSIQPALSASPTITLLPLNNITYLYQCPQPCIRSQGASSHTLAACRSSTARYCARTRLLLWTLDLFVQAKAESAAGISRTQRCICGHRHAFHLCLLVRQCCKLLHDHQLHSEQQRSTRTGSQPRNLPLLLSQTLLTMTACTAGVHSLKAAHGHRAPPVVF